MGMGCEYGSHSRKEGGEQVDKRADGADIYGALKAGGWKGNVA